MPHVMNVDDSKLAMEGYCPVSYQFGPPVLGLPDHVSEYEGAIYRFASTDAKKLFDENPAKYAPLYGGWYVSQLTRKGSYRDANAGNSSRLTPYLCITFSTQVWHWNGSWKFDSCGSLELQAGWRG